MLLDDRGGSPGVAFKDAELLGVPTVLVVGKALADGLVEVRDRRSGTSRTVGGRGGRPGRRRRGPRRPAGRSGRLSGGTAGAAPAAARGRAAHRADLRRGGRRVVRRGRRARRSAWSRSGCSRRCSPTSTASWSARWCPSPARSTSRRSRRRSAAGARRWPNRPGPSGRPAPWSAASARWRRSTALRTVVDETAELFDTVLVSAGRRGLSVELAPADLVRLTAAVVADVAR